MKITPLELVRERKICELLAERPDDERFEASGVLAKNGMYFVVFDNTTSVARVADGLEVSERNALSGEIQGPGGFEGIAFNPSARRYYLLVESRRSGRSFHGEVVECDEMFRHIKTRPLEFEFDNDNKGFEAIAHVGRGDLDYVLALCEGNKCRSGKAGRKRGGGRVQVFEKRKRRWAHVRTIKLPASVQFTDYSAMAIDEDRSRVAVVSQEDSLIWISEFDDELGEWRGGGRLYEFPRTDDGKIAYGNVEGVSWLGHDEIVTVSDKRKKKKKRKNKKPKKGQPKRYAAKDQSIHVFRLAD